MNGAVAALKLAMDRWRFQAEVGVIVAIVMVVALLVLPLPAFMLDLLLALSIGCSLVVLLVSLNSTDPLDFSVFPAVLLLLTLFRLALNVSSTRLILGTGSGGKVIEAFGQFVVGGNWAVGVVIFLILVAINFVVITKGAGRVSEVAARFTLDAMPGRQMSIDADLSAGLVDDAEAKRRREEIQLEADFYGAMDGASKFVRGDAIAGLLITGINIVGGIFVGVVQRGMPIGQALSRYTILTVGDGLVSQIPALVVSVAAGIMVTHSTGKSRVATALISQVGRHPRVLFIAAGFLALLGVVPGLPTVPFLALAIASGMLARSVSRKQREEEVRQSVQRAEAQAEAAETPDPVHELLQLDPVELELGYMLIPLVDETQGGDLLERIRLLRRQAAQALGVLIPAIRIRDDVRLGPSEYVVRVRGSEVARWELMPQHLLALDAGGVLEPVNGIDTADPSFGMAARWIAPDDRDVAEDGGYVVVEGSTIVATHLMETLKANAAELLGRQDVQEMLDALKRSYPALVDDVVPNKVPLGTLHRVLQRLLRERIPIRDLVTILETLADVAEQSKDPEVLTEHVRRALAPVIADLHTDDAGAVRALTLGPKLEAALMAFFSPRQGRSLESLLDADGLTEAMRRLDALSRDYTSEGRLPPLITPPGLRVGIRRLLEPVLPAVPVVSLAELPPQVTLNSLATWELPDAA